MPAARSTVITWLKPDRSTFGLARASRFLKRLDVSFAKPTASAPRLRNSARRRASFCACVSADALIRVPVEVIAGPRRVICTRAVEQDLKQLQGARPERGDRPAQV